MRYKIFFVEFDGYFHAATKEIKFCVIWQWKKWLCWSKRYWNRAKKLRKSHKKKFQTFHCSQDVLLGIESEEKKDHFTDWIITVNRTYYSGLLNKTLGSREQISEEGRVDSLIKICKEALFVDDNLPEWCIVRWWISTKHWREESVHEDNLFKMYFISGVWTCEWEFGAGMTFS